MYMPSNDMGFPIARDPGMDTRDSLRRFPPELYYLDFMDWPSQIRAHDNFCGNLKDHLSQPCPSSRALLKRGTEYEIDKLTFVAGESWG